MMGRGNAHKMHHPTTTATTLVQPSPTWAAEVSASLVAPPPLSPPTVHCPHTARGIPLELSQILSPLYSEPSHGVHLTQRRYRSHHGPQGSAYSDLITSLTSLPHRPPHLLLSSHTGLLAVPQTQACLGALALAVPSV